MKKIVSLLFIAVLMVLTACSSESAAPEAEEAGVAKYDKTQVEILGAEFTDDYKEVEDANGIPAIMVRMHFKNDGNEPLYLLESFGIYAYQDGTELDYISLNDQIREEARNVARGVKDGAELDCIMAFATISDSPVEVRISEPVWDGKELVTETFEK